MAYVIVAEDEPDIADYLELILTENGHQVTLARTVTDAEAAIAAGSVDAVVVSVMFDHRSPVGGIGLAVWVRAEHPTIRVVLMIAEVPGQERDTAWPADAVLRMPWSWLELEHALSPSPDEI